MNILGYANKFSAEVDEEIEIKVSCTKIKTYKNRNILLNQQFFAIFLIFSDF